MISAETIAGDTLLAGLEDDWESASKHLSTFIDEAQQTLDEMIEALLALEAGRGRENVERLLVATHRLKGSAASLGLGRRHHQQAAALGIGAHDPDVLGQARRRRFPPCRARPRQPPAAGPGQWPHWRAQRQPGPGPRRIAVPRPGRPWPPTCASAASATASGIWVCPRSRPGAGPRPGQAPWAASGSAAAGAWGRRVQPL